MSDNVQNQTAQVDKFLKYSFWFFQSLSLEVLFEIIQTPINNRLGENHIVAKLIDHAGSAFAMAVLIFFVLIVRTNKEIISIVNNKISENFTDDWTYGKKYKAIKFWYDFFLPTPVDFYKYVKLSFYVAILFPVVCVILLLLLNSDVVAVNFLSTVVNYMSILIAIDGKRIIQTARAVFENEQLAANEPVV